MMMEVNSLGRWKEFMWKEKELDCTAMSEHYQEFTMRLLHRLPLFLIPPSMQRMEKPLRWRAGSGKLMSPSRAYSIPSSALISLC